MKIKTDTPETDALLGAILYRRGVLDKYTAPEEWVVFARCVERERDEAREIAEAMRRELFAFRHFKENPFPWEKSA